MDAEDPDTLINVLTRAGFKNVSGEKQEKPLLLPSIDPVIAVGRDFMTLHDKPHDLQERIRARAREDAQKYQQTGRSYLFLSKVLVAFGFVKFTSKKSDVLGS